MLPNELMLATFLADYEAETINEPVQNQPDLPETEPAQEIPKPVESLLAGPDGIDWENIKVYVPPSPVEKAKVKIRKQSHN